ncbi:hypothetical protein BC834DRAFT_590358 [Gloeopeniophorella convolvens]|nr:hypothetical protein BC834DRAFT_590358 [Gloeopeniophorella convolvens]
MCQRAAAAIDALHGSSPRSPSSVAPGPWHGLHFIKRRRQSRMSSHPRIRYTLAPAMAQSIVDPPLNFEVHFLDSEDPRHGCRVMSTAPFVFYTFDTPIGFLDTHTTISGMIRVDAEIVPFATFNWFGSSAIGTMTITWPGTPPHNAHMGELVASMGPTMPNCRRFRSHGPDGLAHDFWWHRLPNGDYDLYCEPGTRIGVFRRARPLEHIPNVGDIFATLWYSFQHPPLLLKAILALCLNRWLDLQEGR